MIILQLKVNKLKKKPVTFILSENPDKLNLFIHFPKYFLLFKPFPPFQAICILQMYFTTCLPIPLETSRLYTGTEYKRYGLRDVCHQPGYLDERSCYFQSQATEAPVCSLINVHLCVYDLWV